MDMTSEHDNFELTFPKKRCLHEVQVKQKYRPSPKHSYSLVATNKFITNTTGRKTTSSRSRHSKRNISNSTSIPSTATSRHHLLSKSSSNKQPRTSPSTTYLLTTTRLRYLPSNVNDESCRCVRIARCHCINRTS